MQGKVFDKLLNSFNQLPQFAKIALTVGAVAGTYFAVRWASQKLKKSEDAMEGKAAEGELKKLEGQGVKPSFPAAQYESWAQSIVAAIDSWGTDEAAIYSIFRNMKNDADVYKLIAVYGTRGYYGTLENFFGGNVHRSLTEALRSEMSGSEMNKLNNILKDNGISFSF